MFRDTITLMGEQENGVSAAERERERFWLVGKREGGEEGGREDVGSPLGSGKVDSTEAERRSVLPAGSRRAVRSLSDARTGARHSSRERGKEKRRNRLPRRRSLGKKVNLAAAVVVDVFWSCHIGV